MISRRDLIVGSGAILGTHALLAPEAAFARQAGDVQPAKLTNVTAITVREAPTRQNLVAMTFDDGPHPDLTPKLLDILKARRIRATFYVIGQNVARYPEIVKRMVGEGHELGNHTWSHPYLTKRSKKSVLRELDRTSDAIYKAVRKVPVTMRPPYGALYTSQRRYIHAERQMPTILWSVDPQDWRRPGASVVTKRIVSHARAGAIILSHDIHPGTIRAMPSTLDTLTKKGYRYDTVSMLLGHKDWSRLHWRQAEHAAGRS